MIRFYPRAVSLRVAAIDDFARSRRIGAGHGSSGSSSPSLSTSVTANRSSSIAPDSHTSISPESGSSGQRRSSWIVRSARRNALRTVSFQSKTAVSVRVDSAVVSTGTFSAAAVLGSRAGASASLSQFSTMGASSTTSSIRQPCSLIHSSVCTESA